MNMELVVKSTSGPLKATIQKSDGSILLEDGSRLKFEGKGLARRIGTNPSTGRIFSEWEILESGVFPVGYWR